MVARRKKQLWLRRDSRGWDRVHLFKSINKPKRWNSPGGLYAFCSSTFERITGISLKPGEVVRVESINIELEKNK